MPLTRLFHAPAGLPRPATKLAYRLVATTLLSVGLATPTLAQKPPNVTVGEMALIPPYCPDTMGFKYGDAYTNTSPRAAYWVGLMGKSFWHMHHYCWGMIKIRRADALGVSKVERMGLLKSAVGEMNYVLENGTADFVMRPEVLLRRGDVQLLLGEVGNAMESYEAAVQAKPDYWPAYVNWAEFLLKIKRPKDAQAFLERGLAMTPNEPKLRAAYKRAGGDVDVFVRKLPSAPANAAALPASAASDGR